MDLAARRYDVTPIAVGAGTGAVIGGFAMSALRVRGFAGKFASTAEIVRGTAPQAAAAASIVGLGGAALGALAPEQAYLAAGSLGVGLAATAAIGLRRGSAGFLKERAAHPDMPKWRYVASSTIGAGNRAIPLFGGAGMLLGNGYLADRRAAAHEAGARRQ